eukprot:286948-Chlamydomonas_euryale.AAC.1
MDMCMCTGTDMDMGMGIWTWAWAFGHGHGHLDMGMGNWTFGCLDMDMDKPAWRMNKPALARHTRPPGCTRGTRLESRTLQNRANPSSRHHAGTVQTCRAVSTRQPLQAACVWQPLVHARTSSRLAGGAPPRAAQRPRVHFARD